MLNMQLIQKEMQRGCKRKEIVSPSINVDLLLDKDYKFLRCFGLASWVERFSVSL